MLNAYRDLTWFRRLVFGFSWQRTRVDDEPVLMRSVVDKVEREGFLLSNSVLLCLYYSTDSPRSSSSQHYPEKNDKLMKSGKLKKKYSVVKSFVGASNTKTLSACFILKSFNYFWRIRYVKV